MKLIVSISMALAFISACSATRNVGDLPFRHMSVVATYTPSQLRELVKSQFERRHDRASHEFKRYPSPEELLRLTSDFRVGDQLVEWKNDDYWFGELGMSQEAARAFGVMRGGQIARFVRVWEMDELNSNLPNKAPKPMSTTVTPPAGAGDRASGAPGSP